jgi:hypothetical protein
VKRLAIRSSYLDSFIASQGVAKPRPAKDRGSGSCRERLRGRDHFEEDVLFAVDFLALDFAAVGFRAFEVELPVRVVDFFAVDFPVVAFFAALFFAGERRVVAFAEVFLAGCRFFADVAAFRCFSLASAVPPTAAPTAAAPAAASTGFSATTEATFFAPLPTADTASPAFSVTFSTADCSFAIIPPPRIVDH